MLDERAYVLLGQARRRTYTVPHRTQITAYEREKSLCVCPDNTCAGDPHPPERHVEPGYDDWFIARYNCSADCWYLRRFNG